MNKKLFLSLLLSISSVAFSMIQLDKKSFKSPKHLGTINILHKDDNVFIQKGDQDPVLVNMLGDTLKKGISLKIKEVKEGKSYLNVEDINGQYKIELKSKLKGGALGGAAFGFFLGQALVHGPIQLVMWGACFLMPAAAPAVITAEKLTAPWSIALGNKVGLALGIFFGAATGPV